MQVSTSLASVLRQPTAIPATPHPSAASAFLERSDSARSPGGTTSNQGPLGLRAAGHGELEGGRMHGGETELPKTDAGHPNQGLRRRLAALDRMVSNRLEAFAQKHGELQPGLAEDVDLLSKEFHAALHDAYSAFRETGDRHELMRTVRGAFAEARSGFRFVAATVGGGAPAGDPVVTVDPGPGVQDAGLEETQVGGETTVAGAAGSGVTVDVTPLPETDVASSTGTSGGPQDLQSILDQLVAQFSQLMGGLEDLIANGFEGHGDEPSVKLAINLYAEFQFGGSSLGDLFDSLS